MPRYFFHVRDGVSLDDTYGTEKRDVEAARREAVVLAGNLMRDYPEDFVGAGDWRIDVTDERGLMLFQIYMQLTDSPVSRLNPLTKRNPMADTGTGERAKNST